MGRSKAAQNLFASIGTPPDSLKPESFIVKVIGARGNSLYNVRVPPSSEAKLAALLELPPPAPVAPVPTKKSTQKDDSDSDSDSDSDESDSEPEEVVIGTEITVEMPNKFRNTIFVKRGGFCEISIYQEIVDQPTLPLLTSYKVHGEINNIVVNDRDWQKYGYWPVEFKKQTKGWDISSDEESEDDDEE